MNQQQQTNLVSGLILLIVAMLACSLAQASPMASSNQNQDQDDFSGGEEGPSSVDRHGRNQPEADNDFGGTFTGSTADLSGDSSMDQYQQQPQQYNFNGNSYRPSSSSSSNYNQQQQQQALASENNENQADDDDANEDDDSAGAAAEFEVGSNGGRRAIARALSESAQPWLESSMASADSSSSLIEGVGELEGAIGADSNIANAKIEMSPHDRATAAGHHHHHGHYVHGWLKMGAETGKKGAFKWHDKHPVGGKGRR